MLFKIDKADRRGWWIGLGVLTILLRYVLDGFPWIIEQFYSRGLFLMIRTIFDYSFGLFPFPVLYLLVLLLVVFLVKRGIHLVKAKESLVQKIVQSFISLLAFLGGLIFLFLFCWGFNYGRIPLEEQINIDPKPLKLTELQKELEVQTPLLIEYRQKILFADSMTLQATFSTKDLKQNIKTDLEQTLAQLGYPTTGNPSARLLQPKGILLRISTAGFYLPLTGECNIDAGLHPIQLPFVMAHEYGHAYGITDEGSCNFIAYLTCIQSTNPFVQYAGQMSYWRYLAGSYQSFRPKEYAAFRKKLPKGIVADLNSINENSAKYPDILPRVRDFAYDSYLKSQGLEEGIQSYSRIIMLVKAWNEREQR